MATSPRSFINAGAKPVHGDLKERASLDPACDEIERLITTANSAMRGGEDMADTVDRQGNRNPIEATRAAGVKQFVAPGEPIPGLPEIAPPVLAAMGAYDSPIPMDEAARIFGVEQTSLASVARRMFSKPGV